MNRIIIIIALVFPIFTHSQNNVSTYYYWINQAELAIFDSNWNYANNCYDSAFLYKKPFARDLLMAYEINVMYTQDNERILKFAHERLLCGDSELSISYARRNNCDSSLIIKLKMLEDNVKPLCDKKIQNLLDTIIVRDQQYHFRRVSPKDHRIAYRKNMNDIKKIYRENPIVNEYVAGIYYMGYLLGPLTHFVQEDNNSLQRILKKEVKKGNFDAHWYMRLEDGWRKKKKEPYGTDCFFLIDNVLFYFKPDNIEKINMNRKKLGISETFDDYVRKVICQHQNGSVRLLSIVRRNYPNNIEEIMRLKEEIDEEHKHGNFQRMYYESAAGIR